MGKIYRIMVVEQDEYTRPGWEGGALPGRVLFEAASPDAGRLLAYAPGEVATALTVAVYGETPQEVSGLVDLEALRAVTETTEAPAEEATERDAPPAPAAEAPRPRRPRRTKAQIEADNAAALASQADADPGPENQEALGDLPDAPVPAVEPPPAAPAPAADGKPWNPFERQ